MDKPTIAHELGHVIVSYLYDRETRPTSMILKPGPSSKAWVNFDSWENLPVADYNLSRLKGVSYLGGIFGELLWHQKFNVFGVRGDVEEYLSELRFMGKDGKYRRSRSKIFKELFNWYYVDKDEWSFGGRMNAWMNSSQPTRSLVISEKRVKDRLPELYSIYSKKFAGLIDTKEFKGSVNDFYNKDIKVVRSGTLLKHARKIIPSHVLSPENL